ncbi:BAHD acyltransferase At5g47980-like [Coffea eugenioides]|uniref:BAHD acyltransferase At5g47980-like n=1 Tax=Coffea eugenioides TaxID=49369 RepID=UPI000F609B8C|nr:BAHD acyltransferase At5g47980-like [Coffea eugenioides]XP_027171421.1 BAHD acyltransferase At5g47980-like [Coffea eugenioides]
MDVKIISREEIKPESPTPEHLRIHRLSIFDQLIGHIYSSPLVFFYPNKQSSNLTDVISERQRLKRSLSETLVPFYPLAGRIKDDFEIQCNDEVVYYAEARVNIQLSEFLKQPTNQMIHQLLPFHPNSEELLSKTHLVMIQTNIFYCGGIAIGLYASHKIVDGLSRLTFLNSWAARARNESSKQVNPSFISSSVFPPDPSLSTYSRSNFHNQTKEKHNFVTSRFVFDHSALALLKIKAACSSTPIPSSIEVVMGLLSKSFINATKVKYGTTLFVDDFNPELPLLVHQISDAIASIDGDFVEGIKGDDRLLKLIGSKKHLREKYSYNAESFPLSSVCRSGLYEADFGWGKPIWACLGSGDTDPYGVGNLVILMDTRSGEGIEAWVTVKEELMAIFEKNQELLAFASLNPSPLEI